MWTYLQKEGWKTRHYLYRQNDLNRRLQYVENRWDLESKQLILGRYADSITGKAETKGYPTRFEAASVWGCYYQRNIATSIIIFNIGSFFDRFLWVFFVRTFVPLDGVIFCAIPPQKAKLDP